MLVNGADMARPGAQGTRWRALRCREQPAAGGNLRYGAVYHRRWLPTLEALGVPPGGLHVLRHSAAARMRRTRPAAKRGYPVNSGATTSAVVQLSVVGSYVMVTCPALGLLSVGEDTFVAPLATNDEPPPPASPSVPPLPAP
jgi:hypothetical protein